MPLTAIFADAHLDAENCLRKEFYEAVATISPKMDLVIFNGDFIDTYGTKGRKALEEFIEWGKEQGLKEKMVFITGGMGHEGNVLYDQPDIQVLPYAIIETKEGRIVIFHGHNVGLVKRQEEQWVSALKRLKRRLINEKHPFLPPITSVDKLVLAHCHVPCYDLDAGVFATGAWTIPKELQENDEWKKRMVGVFLVIDDEKREDPIQMIRWFKKETKRELVFGEKLAGKIK